MRAFYLGFVSVSIVIFCACSAGGEQMTGSGGAGPLDCQDNVSAEDPCNSCLQQRCCAELVACMEVPECFYCWYHNPESTHCDEDPQKSNRLALEHCMLDTCPESCGEPWNQRPTNPNCMDIEPGGGVTLADCASQETSVLRGTIDGKPFDEVPIQTFLGQNSITKHATWGISFFDAVNGYGSLDLTWYGYMVTGIPMPVTGTLELPGEKVARIVDPGSTLWVNCAGQIYGFSLVIKGGDHVTGCAHGY